MQQTCSLPGRSFYMGCTMNVCACVGHLHNSSITGFGAFRRAFLLPSTSHKEGAFSVHYFVEFVLN